MQTKKNSLMKQLLNILRLRQIDSQTFEGNHLSIGSPIVYGGQTVAQCLMAAFHTIKDDQVAHSLHGYFLRPGNLQQPIRFHVETLSNGSTFANREVTAMQKNKIIFRMMASFHCPESGLSHAQPMPAVTPPDLLQCEMTRRLQFTDSLPESKRENFAKPLPFELRLVNPTHPFHPEVHEPQKWVWLKAVQHAEGNARMQQVLLAYATDFGLLSTSLLPHGKSAYAPDLKMTSLDHSIHFHRPCDVNDWLLFSMHSPSASDGRGFNRGDIYDKAGNLVASVSQEGLLRLR